MVPSSSGPPPSSKEVEAWVSRIDEIHEAVSEILHSDPADDLARVEAREAHRKEWLAQQEKARLEIVKMRYEPKYYGRYEKDEFIEEQLKKVDEPQGHASELQRKHRNAALQDSTLFSKAERLSLEEAYRLKEEGAGHVRKGEWEAALKVYDGALKLGIDDMDPPLSVVIHNNRALVRNKLGAYSEVCEDATYVLQREPLNVKALLRRATALRFLHRPVEALKDVSKALHLEPTNGEGLRLRAWLQKAEGEILLSDRFVEEAAPNARLTAATKALAACLPTMDRHKTEKNEEPSPAMVLQRVAEVLRTSSVEEVWREASLFEKTLRVVEEGGIGAAVWFGLQGGVASVLCIATQFLQQLAPPSSPGAVSVASVMEEGRPRSPADAETSKGNTTSSSSNDEKKQDDASGRLSTGENGKPQATMASSTQKEESGDDVSSSSFRSVDATAEEKRYSTVMDRLAIPLVHCLHLLSVLFEGCETVSQDASDSNMQCFLDHLLPAIFPTFLSMRRVKDADAAAIKLFHASLECVTSLYPFYGDRINRLLDSPAYESAVAVLWESISSAGKAEGKPSPAESGDSPRHFLTVLLFIRFLTACLHSQGGVIDLPPLVSPKTEDEGETSHKRRFFPAERTPSPSPAGRKLVHQLFFSPVAPNPSHPVSDDAVAPHASSEMIMEVVTFGVQKNMPIPIQSAAVLLALRRSAIQVVLLPVSSASWSDTPSTRTVSDPHHLQKKVVPLQWRHQRWTALLCASFSGILLRCRQALPSSASLSTELHFLEAFYSVLYNLCLSAPDREDFVRYWNPLCGNGTLTDRTWNYVCAVIESTTNGPRMRDSRTDGDASLFLSSTVLPKMLGVLAKFVPFLPSLQVSMGSRRMASPAVISVPSSDTALHSTAVGIPHPSCTEDRQCPLWVLLHSLATSHLHENAVEKEKKMIGLELLEHLSTILGVLVRSQQGSIASPVLHAKSDPQTTQGSVVVVVVQGPFCAENMRDLLTLLAMTLPPSEEAVLQWKETHLEGKGTAFSSSTSHLSMPLVTLGNLAILIAMMMDISAVLAQQTSAVVDAKYASSTPLKEYPALLAVLKEKDAVSVLLHSIRASRTSLLMLAKERADAEKKNTERVLASLRSWEEHCLAAQKNLGIAISKVVMASDDMRARLRELNGLETLAAVVRQVQ